MVKQKLFLANLIELQKTINRKQKEEIKFRDVGLVDGLKE